MTTKTTPNGGVWFVTGSSTGFGRTIVDVLLQRGHRVAATARTPEKLSDLVEKYPETVKAIRLDVNDPDDIQVALETAIEAFGKIDVLVNNAGYGLIGALEEVTDAQIERNLATNFIGPINVIRAALPHFRARKSGHIVNMSAIAAFNNEMGFSIYGAAKAALEAASEALAGEVAPLGIKVTIVEPGPFRTDFIGRSLDRTNGDIADYQQTVGNFLAFLEKIDGSQPGDPVKAAEAIVAAVESENPPRRLALGAYAIKKIEEKLKAVEADLTAWKTISLGTDYADAVGHH